MKKLITALLVLTASTAFGAGFLQYDASQQTKIQGYAPDGAKMTAVTALVSTTVDMTNWLAFSVYCAVDSKLRLMPTSAKGSYAQHTIPAGVRVINVVNRNTPFINYSGACELGGM